jgi:hypothetical protein
MSESFNDSVDPAPAMLRETPPDYGFEFPIEPGYRERPPRGGIEAGIRLGLLAIEQIKERPQVFAQREARRCDVEFKL